MTATIIAFIVGVFVGIVIAVLVAATLGSREAFGPLDAIDKPCRLPPGMPL